MNKIIVLGAGMIGRTIAADLADRHQVVSADLRKDALDLVPESSRISKIILDVRDGTALEQAIRDMDIVISAVPGFLGFQTMDRVISMGKDLVDISFMPEDYMTLDEHAKLKGTIVVADSGVAPGLPNYIIGFHNETMKINTLEYMVGGLPKTRYFPFEYKAPFSPVDVIAEYTRPARFMENGRIVVRPALSDSELVNFDKAGTLEAFNTDGLRSLLHTMNHIPSMKEKTLRYPGHINLIKALQASGFFGREPVEVNGSMVAPIDFTSRILFKVWELNPSEPEFTVLRVIIKGEVNGNMKEIVYDLYDEFDQVENTSSMARTTGFTASASAELILNKKFSQKGVFPPELIGRDPQCFKDVFNYLGSRNIKFRITEKPETVS